MDKERLFVCGLRPDGSYLVDPLAPGDLATRIINSHQGRAASDDEAGVERDVRAKEPHLGCVPRVEDPADLAQAGWGVIFPATEQGSALHRRQERIREALAPLLDLRKGQARAGGRERYYQEYFGQDGYHLGEGHVGFLSRHGASPGPANPERVPYYLLLVGDPERLPYALQHDLDLMYSVGRVHFETLEQYHHYAVSVVQAEAPEAALPRHAAFFGTSHPGDAATALSLEHLVTPLRDWFAGERGDAWRVDSHLGDGADRAALEGLLGGPRTPALLFTGSHGMGPCSDDPAAAPPEALRQRGALVCQEWPGMSRGEQNPVLREHLFCGEDLAGDARLQGMIAFFFACFGAGSPRHDSFPREDFADPEQIAPHAFVADLPARLLSHRGRGALAVVGHVDLAFPHSFFDQRLAQEHGPRFTDLYEGALLELARGKPVGLAMESFGARYAALFLDLQKMLRNVRAGMVRIPEPQVMKWLRARDARGFVVVGDPAVRLNLQPAPGSAQGARPPATPLAAYTVQGEEPAKIQALNEPEEDPTTDLFNDENDGNAFALSAAPSANSDAGTSAGSSAKSAAPDRPTATGLQARIERLLAGAARARVTTYRERGGKKVPFATTRLDPDGAAEVIQHQEREPNDEPLWRVHQESVRELLRHQRELLAAAIPLLGPAPGNKDRGQ